MSIVRKFFTVSGITIISRILGVVREAMSSHFLGACLEMDAFLIAFKFPAFFRKCFAEGGFQSIFVPYFTDFTASEKSKGAKYFSSRVFTIIFWAMLFITTLVLIFAKEFVLVMAPGFSSDPQKLALTTEFTRIIFPSVAFVALSSVYSSILLSKKKFFVFSMVQILVNFVLITALLIGQDTISAGRRLAYGALAGGIFQFIYLYICIHAMKLPRPNISKVHLSPKMKQFFKKLSPVLVGAGVVQINIFMGTLFGSFLSTGGITYLYFADRFVQLPLAIFGISMATILLPEIATCIAKGKHEEIKKTQTNALLFTLRLTLPSVVGLISLSYLMISALYGHGKFSESSVQKTADILKFYSIGIPAYVASKILASALFAKKDAKTPITASIYSIIVNIILCGILIIPLQEIGIALAASISGFVNTYIMYGKSKDIISIDKSMIISLAKIISASVVMCAIIEFLKYIFIINHSNIISEIIFLGLFCFAGFASFITALCIFRDETAIRLLNSAKRKFFKS